MSKLGMIILLLSMTACAEEKKKDGASPARLISEIPQDCQALTVNGQLAYGSHEFALGNVQLAVGFDCGVREGKRCYYFIHTGATRLEDVRCD